MQYTLSSQPGHLMLYVETHRPSHPSHTNLRYNRVRGFQNKPSVFAFLEVGRHCIDHLFLLIFFFSILTQRNCPSSKASLLYWQDLNKHHLAAESKHVPIIRNGFFFLYCCKTDLSTNIMNLDSPASYLSSFFICNFLLPTGYSLMQMTMFIIN